MDKIVETEVLSREGLQDALDSKTPSAEIFLRLLGPYCHLIVSSTLFT